MTDAVCFCGNFARGLCVKCSTPACREHAFYRVGMLHCYWCDHWAARAEILDGEVRVELLAEVGAFKRRKRSWLVPGAIFARPAVKVNLERGNKVRVDDRGNVTTGGEVVYPSEPRHQHALAELCARHGIDESRVATLVAVRLAAEQSAAARG